MYITLNQAKKHLNIESAFTDDDSYIESLIEVAETAVERSVKIPLVDLLDSSSNLPAPLAHAVLLMVGNLFANRESVAYSTAIEVPKSFDYLISLYENFSDAYSEETEQTIIDEIIHHLIITDGQLTIDSEFNEHINCLFGTRKKLYRRLVDRVLSSATIDASGNITIDV